MWYLHNERIEQIYMISIYLYCSLSVAVLFFLLFNFNKHLGKMLKGIKVVLPLYGVTQRRGEIKIMIKTWEIEKRKNMKVPLPTFLSGGFARLHNID